jgi:RNA polymerase sigma-70 factor (ECF subfamily)
LLTKEKSVDQLEKQARFEELVMPHLDAAYNLARWLTRNEHDAQDIVQEAFLRAYKFFNGFRGSNPRSWLLSIVRNATYNWLEKNRRKELIVLFDEEVHGADNAHSDPITPLLRELDHDRVREAIEELPVEYREMMVLRELEGFSYKELSELAQVPIGTVMSRLSRARKQLHTRLSQLTREERAV